MTAPRPPGLDLGAHAPAFNLPATDGQTYDLHSFDGKKYLTVIILTEGCPFVSAWQDRIVAIAHEFMDRGFGFVAVNPSDTLDAMGKDTYPFPYLRDEGGTVTRQFGATHVPEVFVFGPDRHLLYHGAVDSDPDQGAYMRNYLRDALDQLINGRPIALPETPLQGCSVQTG